MSESSRAFWRGFWKGWNDPRLWVWLFPVVAGLDLLAFVREPGGWRWVWLGFAVVFLIAAGWDLREVSAVRFIRSRQCDGRDLIVAAAALHAGRNVHAAPKDAGAGR